MALFNRNKKRKINLKRSGRTKYQMTGAMSQSGLSQPYGNTMYGENLIPGAQDTSSQVYQQSSPEYQQQLNESLESVQNDPNYLAEAQNETADRERNESIATTIGTKGLNLGMDKLGVEDRFKEASMLSNFRSGVQGYKVASGAKNAGKILSQSENVSDLITGLNTVGTQAKTVGGGIKAGVKGAVSGMGPGGVGALVSMAGKGVTKLASDDDATTLTGGETGGALLEGAGAGLGAAGLGAGLSTALGVGAANAWNPFGWATLTAASIGAGVTALNRKRKANRAGDDVDDAENRRESDMNTLYAKKRADALKDRSYSGYNFGQDQNQGFYGKTGGVKYQSLGAKETTMPLFGSNIETPKLDRFGYPITNAPLYGGTTNVSDGTDTSFSTTQGLPQQDINIIPESESNVTPYQSNEDKLAALNDDTQSGGQASSVAADTLRRQQIDKDRGYSIQTMEDGTTVRVPISTHPTEEQMDLAEAQNKGINPNAAFMYPQSIQGDTKAMAKYRLENPLTNPEGLNMAATIAATPSIASSASGAGVTGSVPLQATRWGINQIAKPTVNMLKTASSNFKAMVAPNVNISSRLLHGLKGGYYTKWAAGMPGAYGAVANQINTEIQGEGSAPNRTDALKSVVDVAPPLHSVYEVANAGIDAAKGESGNAALHIAAAASKTNPLLQYGFKAANIGTDYLGDDIEPNIASSTLGMISPTLKRTGGVRNLPGGKAVDIGNGATKYVGQTHEQGGIMADPQSEIEDNEIEKDVTLADGTMNPYIFSEYLKMDGTKNYNNRKKSIANVAEDLALQGAPQSEFDALAQEQEKQAGRSGNKIMTMAKYGGYKYQDRGVKKVSDTNVLGDDLNPFNAAKRLYYDYLDKDRTSDRAGNALRILATPASTTAQGMANVAYPFMGEEQQGKHEEMIGTYQQANKNLDKHKEILKAEGKYKTPWESIKGIVGYKEGGVTKYQTKGLGLSEFEKAFAQARKAGNAEFTFEDKPYTTKTKEEKATSSPYTSTTGQGNIVDDIMNSTEAVERRERDAWNEKNVYGLATGAIQPMEGLNDPVFSTLLGARTMYNPVKNLVKTALGPKNPLNKAYNLYPQSPNSLYGTQPTNIYEKLAHNISRYGTRSGSPSTFVQKAADFVGGNLPNFLKSPSRLGPAFKTGGVRSPLKYQTLGTTNLPSASYLNSNYVAPNLSLNLSNFPTAGAVPASTSSSTSGSTYTSPFEEEADERAFQDWINSKGGNTGGYGWGKDSAKAWADYGGRYNELLAAPPVNREGLSAVNNDHLVNPGILLSDEDSAVGPDGGGGAGGDGGGDDKPKIILTKKEERALNSMERDIPLAAYGAGAAQLLPAMYAFLHKEKAQKLLSAPERLRAPHLDRVNYNTERSRNNSDNRALNRFLDTSGGGPASVIGRMAAYRAKQKGDMEITAAETRANTQIGNTEAQMEMNVADKNAANQLRVGMVNTQMQEAQRIAEENTKKEAIDAGVQNIAGMTGDALTYMGQAKLSRAIGPDGIHDRNRLREALRRTVNPNTGAVYTNKEIAELFNTTRDETE